MKGKPPSLGSVDVSFPYKMRYNKNVIKSRRYILEKNVLLTLFIGILITTFLPVTFADTLIQLNRENGVVHQDGSYQFSDPEVRLLSAWLNNPHHSDSTMLDMLEEIVPNYVSSLSQDESFAYEAVSAFPLKMKSLFSVNTPLGFADHNPKWIQDCRTEFARSGVGLLVTGISERSSGTWSYVVTTAQMINSTTQNLVGYSVNAGTNANYVQATVYREPPTGTYHGRTYHSLPYYCPVNNHESTITIETGSSSISYVFP